MKTFVETVVGGAIGLIALYVVGKVAFQAGRELATAECAYKELQKKTTKHDEKEKTEDASPSEPDETEPARDGIILESVPKKKPGRLSLALAATNLFRQKDSVIGNLIKHPEAHKIEAFVDGEDIHIDVRKRPALA